MVPCEHIQAFMHGLRDLEARHKVKVTGCGCCGSPAADCEVCTECLLNIDNYSATVSSNGKSQNKLTT